MLTPKNLFFPLMRPVPYQRFSFTLVDSFKECVLTGLTPQDFFAPLPGRGGHPAVRRGGCAVPSALGILEASPTEG